MARGPSAEPFRPGQVGLGWLGPLCGVFRDRFESGSVGNAGTCRPKRPCRVQKPLSPAYCPIRSERPDARKQSPMLTRACSLPGTRQDRLPHPQNVGSSQCEPTADASGAGSCGQGFRGHAVVQHSSGLGAIGADDRSWRACEAAKHRVWSSLQLGVGDFLSERSLQPVMVSGGGIPCISGYRVALHRTRRQLSLPCFNPRRYAVLVWMGLFAVRQHPRPW